MECVGVASLLPTFCTFFAILISYAFLCSCMAAPILAPDITNCHPPSDLPPEEPIFDCFDRFGDGPKPGYGTAEWFPHNSVHLFVGKSTEIGYKDMGSFYAAGRDPIFYAHHANLDRFWEVWKGIEGRQEFDEPDFLDSEFVFYNEKAELVKVRVRDCLSTEKLGYTYEAADNTWINARPPPLSKPSSKSEALNASLCKLTDDELLAEPCIILLGTEMVSDLEQIFVIERIRVHEGSFLAAGFHVFLNLPHANSSTTINCAEYAGSFQFRPFMMGNPAILRLGIASQPNFIITIVPYGVLNSISVSGVRTEYESGKTQLFSLKLIL